MGIFYKHDVEQSRKESAERHRLAQIAFPNSQPHRVVEYQILKLAHIANFGLPDCYESFQDMLYDFWPDFSWNDKDRVNEVNLVLADSRLDQIAETITREWGYDIIDELKCVLPIRTANQD